MKLLNWGIYLIVFCLPLYLVRFKILGIPTTVLEMMIYTLVIIWLINRLIGGQLLKRSQRKLSFLNYRYFIPDFIPVLLILFGVSLATIFSSDLRASAGTWKAWFVDPILFFVILISVIENLEQVKKVLFSLFLSGSIVSVISLIYLVQGKLDVQGRLQAFYNSPNYLAMYLVPALILGFGLWIMAKDRLKKVLLFIVSCFMFYVLWHTHSYGAWLGIIAAIGVGLGLYLYKRNKKLILVVICLGLLLILGLGYLKFNQPEADQSFDARLVILQKALQIFKENPIFGIGPGTFGNYFPSFPEWGVPQPHNLYLAFLLQTGIIGFIGFIWLLIWFFHPTGGQPQADKFKILLMMIMAYILVHGLVDTTYWKNDLAVVFWLTVGLMVILRHRTDL